MLFVEVRLRRLLFLFSVVSTSNWVGLFVRFTPAGEDGVSSPPCSVRACGLWHSAISSVLKSSKEAGLNALAMVVRMIAWGVSCVVHAQRAAGSVTTSVLQQGLTLCWIVFSVCARGRYVTSLF